ncbi:hypothetical protein G6F59_018238 [Rhizopus arrhizus]|nr:hypothetical protein G6F59_018238 [Rhizopus arrhizus]
MHAYALGTLQGSIAVRRSRAGETLKLLDGRDAALDDSFLVVTDADRAVGLAGLMGGVDTRVTDATTAVFLEAAHFAPAAIMGPWRRSGTAAHRHRIRHPTGAGPGRRHAGSGHRGRA